MVTLLEIDYVVIVRSTIVHWCFCAGGHIRITAGDTGCVKTLFYQDEEMRDTYSRYPEVLFVDATYKLNNVRMPLYVFAVEDGNEGFVGFCLVGSEESSCLQDMLGAFTGDNPCYTKTQTIVTDKDRNLRSN